MPSAAERLPHLKTVAEFLNWLNVGDSVERSTIEFNIPPCSSYYGADLAPL